MALKARHKREQMRTIRSAFKILALAATLIFPDIALAAPPSRADEGKYVLKPGTDIPTSTLRRLKSRGERTAYFGALALNRIGPFEWFATSGANSAIIAAETAKLSCETKAGPGSQCEVVALKVPSNVSGSFEQMLQSTGMSHRCVQSWLELRDPTRRDFFRARGMCVYVFDSGTDRQNLKVAREPGHTLQIARNDFYGAAFVFGADAERAKQKALAACERAHASLLAIENFGRSWDPAARVSNRVDLTIELEAIKLFNRAHPQKARCRIVASEVLP